MKKFSNNLLLALVVVAVVGGLGYNYYYKHQLAQRTDTLLADQSTGRHRPDFTLPDQIGLPHDVKEWDGKTLVLNFWATWCRPCRRELPMLNTVQQRYADKGVQIVAISLDDRQAVEGFIKATGIHLDLQVLVGDDDAIPVAKDYGNETGLLPYTVIVDSRGMIRYNHFGEISENELTEQLATLITARMSPIALKTSD